MRHTSKVPALERGLEILKLLSARPLSAAQLQQHLNIHRASVYRLLDALQEAKFVAQDPVTSAYGLGPQLMTLGYLARTHSPLTAAARPLLQRISAATHAMGELTVYAGGWQLLVLDTWVSEETPVRINSRAGMLLELHHLNGQGLCYLAHGSARRLELYIELSKTSAGRKTLVLPQACDTWLLKQCANFRELGYAWRTKTRHLENGRVTAPIFNRHQEMIGALGIICDSRRLTPLRAAEWGSLLKNAARELEEGVR